MKLHKAKGALKQPCMLAGRQVRDLHRQLIQLGQAAQYAPILPIMERIVHQQRGDRNSTLLAGMGFNLMLLLRALAGSFFVFLLGALGWLGLRRQEHLHQTT